MIELTKLLDEEYNFPHSLRYSENSRTQKKGAKKGMGPVIAWNITRNCNLKCEHCYSSSFKKDFSGELSTKEIKNIINDLAEMNVPVILLSGGEPLLRDDIFEIITYARNKDIRITLSTNGTLINKSTAEKIKKIGVSYVGISLDGNKETHNKFRRNKSAFANALKGINNCLKVDQKVGLRFTINKSNFKEIPFIINLMEKKEIPRACFYHLVYSGRAEELQKQDINNKQKREILDFLIKKSKEYLQKEINKEILTVANQADGVYAYLKSKEENPLQAEKILKLLKYNGGNRSGIAIGSIDWEGNVRPNQFMAGYTLGNISEKKFSEIWNNSSSEENLLYKLRNRENYLKGKCSNCTWLEICNGNSRIRAKTVYDDFWEEDPACYLSDQELGIEEK